MMKNHTTVTITKKWLEERGACDSGVRDIAELLPAVISTNPEENIEIALGLCRLDLAWRVYWLLDGAGIPISEAYMDDDYDVRSYNEDHDVMLAQQRLAWFADVIATKEGR